MVPRFRIAVEPTFAAPGRAAAATFCTSAEDNRSKNVVIAPIETPELRRCNPRNSPMVSKSSKILGSINLFRSITNNDWPPAIGKASIPCCSRWLRASSIEWGRTSFLSMDTTPAPLTRWLRWRF